MASWKKVLVSGSAAELSSLTLDTALPVAQGGTNATSLADKAVLISQDSGDDTVNALALTGNGEIVVGGSSGPAVEAAADVAGTGLTAVVGDGTLVINVDAAQTQITDVGALDAGSITSGFGNIDNGTSTLNTGNATVDNLVNDSSVANSRITGSFTGSFVGDGTGLTGTGLDIDSLSALGGTGLHQTQDHFVFSDNGTEKKITFSNLEDAIFGNVSGDATIAAGGALTIGANAVEGSMLNSNVAGTGLDYGSNELSVDVSDFMTSGSNNRVLTATGTDGQNAEANLTFDGSTLVVNGNLEVAGTQTTVNSTNLLIEDRFVLLNSGSSATGDGGILVGSGSAYSSSAFIFDDSEDRWGVQIDTQLGSTAATAVPEAYSSLLVLNAHTGSSTYTKNGNLRIDDSGDIFIYVE